MEEDPSSSNDDTVKLPMPSADNESDGSDSSSITNGTDDDVTSNLMTIMKITMKSWRIMSKMIWITGQRAMIMTMMWIMCQPDALCCWLTSALICMKIASHS